MDFQIFAVNPPIGTEIDSAHEVNTVHTKDRSRSDQRSELRVCY